MSCDRPEIDYDFQGGLFPLFARGARVVDAPRCRNELLSAFGFVLLTEAQLCRVFPSAAGELLSAFRRSKAYHGAP